VEHRTFLCDQQIQLRDAFFIANDMLLILSEYGSDVGLNPRASVFHETMVFLLRFNE